MGDIKENLTLIQYLQLNPKNVINLRFSHYYYYIDTLVDLTTSVGFKNLKLSPLKPLSEQIQNKIIIPEIVTYAQGEPLYQMKRIKRRFFVMKRTLFTKKSYLYTVKNDA